MEGCGGLCQRLRQPARALAAVPAKQAAADAPLKHFVTSFTGLRWFGAMFGCLINLCLTEKNMHKFLRLAAGVFGAAALMSAAVPALAGHVDVGVNIGVPAPVYVEPRPVYVQPRPVYVEPRPVYVEPRPVYVERGHGWREHEWREHEWRERRWHERHEHRDHDRGEHRGHRD
jgi:hypothetical protein